ncbi:N-acetyltransferase family protein [Cellulomonas hominis]
MPLFADYRPDVRGSVDARVLVRGAVPADVPGIVGVAATRSAPRAGFSGLVGTWVLDDARTVLVAEADRAVVGWAMVDRWSGHDDAPDGWYVSALTVHPGQRRRGIGDRLLAGLMTWAWERTTVLRSVVNAGNLPSVELHRRRGFREAARSATFAGITFEGGTGVLLRADRPEAAA